MSRTSLLLVTTAFLGAQMLSFAHAADCSSRDHKHKRIECEICINANYQDYTDPGNTSEVCVIHRAQCSQQLPTDIIVVRDSHEAGINRGPPPESVNRLTFYSPHMRAGS
ncbi:MAG: hypothetical protein OXF23_03250 [Candidatus Dadabacteria bacterium]|nr:hypothetical protein [Candidatus Dadabacteria bacterium]